MAGRPIALKTLDPDELQALVDEYFENLWDERTFHLKDGNSYTEPFQRPATMAGLARHLGVVRATLYNYVHRRDEVEAIVRPVLTRALDRLAERAEEATFDRDLYNGGRFALEVNHRYGKEDQGGNAGGFSQTIVAPNAVENEDAPLAIPHWGDDD